jgi:hypothetical protein
MVVGFCRRSRSVRLEIESVTGTFGPIAVVLECAGQATVKMDGDESDTSNRTWRNTHGG